MLTAQTRPTIGDCFVDGVSVHGSHRHNALHRIGYCPQSDALYPDMTAMEHLRLYAAMYGIPRRRIEPVLILLSYSNDNAVYGLFEEFGGH